MTLLLTKGRGANSGVGLQGFRSSRVGVMFLIELNRKVSTMEREWLIPLLKDLDQTLLSKLGLDEVGNVVESASRDVIEATPP